MSCRPPAMSPPSGGSGGCARSSASSPPTAVSDRLVAHAHLRPGRVVLGQPTRDLLRRPVQFELGRHERPQRRPDRQQTRLRPPRPSPSPVVRIHRPVTTPTTVSRDLPADRRDRPTQTPPDQSVRLLARQASRDLFPLLERQRPGATPLSGSFADHHLLRDMTPSATPRPVTWRRGPACSQQGSRTRSALVNIGDPWPDLDEAELRVLAMQRKLHHWAKTDPERRFDDLHNLVYESAGTTRNGDTPESACTAPPSTRHSTASHTQPADPTPT